MPVATGRQKIEPVNGNPVAELVKRMGLTLTTVSRLTGINQLVLDKALQDPPASHAVRALLHVMIATGMHLRLKTAPPISLWINRKHLQAMYWDESWRKHLGYPKHPKTRGELRKWIRYNLRTQTGRSNKKVRTYGEITDFLTNGYVCTAEGLVNWRGSTIGQIIAQGRAKFPTDSIAITPGREMMDRWERMLVERIFKECRSVDPLFMVRYAVEAIVKPDKIWLVSREKMVEKPREWFLEAMSRIVWLNGAWGEAEFPVSENASIGE